MNEYTSKKVSTFRERFSELCDSNPKNDSGIAAELHVSRQTVHYWKLGERSPKTPTIIAIANYFNVDVAWLMGFDVPKYDTTVAENLYGEERSTLYPLEDQPKTSEARILAKGIDRLPKEKREQALAMFKVMFEPQFADLFNKETDDDET